MQHNSALPSLTPVLDQGVELTVRDGFLTRALEAGHLEAARLVLRLGVSRASRERACGAAVQRQWWDLAQEVVELGVGTETRSHVFGAAVKADQVSFFSMSQIALVLQQKNVWKPSPVMLLVKKLVRQKSRIC